MVICYQYFEKSCKQTITIIYNVQFNITTMLLQFISQESHKKSFCDAALYMYKTL